MALRVHFTAEDLARVRVATTPDPLWELVTSLHRIHVPATPARYHEWYTHVRRRTDATPRLSGAVRLLAGLVPARGDFPDFLTPPGAPGHEGFDGAMELIGATPAGQVSREVARSFRRRRPTPWVRRLVDGDREPRQELHAALRLYHREIVRPYMPVITESFLAQRSRHGEMLLAGGVGKLLATLSPEMHWRAPVLTVGYPADRDLHLVGRGITLVPSYFCQRNPVSLIDPGLPPVLVYPVKGRPATPQAPSRGDGGRLGARVPRGVAELLGETRAIALLELDSPCSTSELARRIGVTSGTASRHATALRGAGLVESVRQGNLVVHRATGLGRKMLGV